MKSSFHFPHLSVSSLFHFHFPQFSRRLYFQASLLLSSSLAFIFLSLSHAGFTLHFPLSRKSRPPSPARATIHDLLPLQPATDHGLLPLPLSRLSRQTLSSFCFKFLLCERSGVEFKRIVEFKFIFFGCCCWVSLEFKQCKFCCGLCYEFCFISTLVFML